VEIRILHAKWLKDPFLKEGIQAHAGECFHEVAEHVGIESVGKLFAGVMFEGEFCQGPDFFAERGDVVADAWGEARLGEDVAELREDYREVIDTRSMRVEVADGNGTVGVGGFIGGVGRVERCEHMVIGEHRDEVGYRLVEKKLSLFKEHHYSKA